MNVLECGFQLRWATAHLERVLADLSAAERAAEGDEQVQTMIRAAAADVQRAGRRIQRVRRRGIYV